MLRFVTSSRASVVAWRQASLPGNPAGNANGGTAIVTVSGTGGAASGNSGSQTVPPRRYQHQYFGGRGARGIIRWYTQRSQSTASAPGGTAVVTVSAFGGAADGAGPTSANVPGGLAIVTVGGLGGAALAPGAGIEAAICSALSANSTLAALIENRAYPDEAPQDCAYPCIVFTCIACTPVQSLAGDSGQDNHRWQFSCWAETFDEARAVGEALTTAMAGSAQFIAVRIGGPYSGPVEPDLKLFHRIVEFSTWQ